MPSIMLFRPRFAMTFALGVLGLAACHSRTELVGYDHCDRFPPDTVPLPPIEIRASADSPGVFSVKAHTVHGSENSIIAVLDQTGRSAQGGRARFAAVSPGVHRLSVRSYGYGTRDTLITMPLDSGLYADVLLSRGGGLSYCGDGVYEYHKPWWKFW